MANKTRLCFLVHTEVVSDKTLIELNLMQKRNILVCQAFSVLHNVHNFKAHPTDS